MKKYFLLVFVVFAISAKAQITFEHDYDSSSTYASGSPVCQDQLMIINFEVSGERYVRINRHGKNICIYDMNHSLLKKIDFSNFPFNSSYPNDIYILYLSENLFDLDPDIDFMFGTSEGYIGIYNDDGSLLFSDSAAPVILPNIPSQQFPIYNSSLGTKMILSYKNGHAKVFSLPGTLNNSIVEANSILHSQSSVSNAYPNPTNNTTQIDYSLPLGINEGEIIFYDLQGKEIKRFKVDRTFNTLIISTADIPAGTYYYQLQTTADNSEGKKMVVIK